LNAAEWAMGSLPLHLQEIFTLARDSSALIQEMNTALGISAMSVMSGEQEKTSLRIRLRPWPGGIKIAHLHFKGDIYLLNESQWKNFSVGVVREFQNKLAKVNTVSFEQVMEISEAVDGIVT